MNISIYATKGGHYQYRKSDLKLSIRELKYGSEMEERWTMRDRDEDFHCGLECTLISNSPLINPPVIGLSTS